MFCYGGSLKVKYHRGIMVVLPPNNLNKTNIFPAVFGVQRRGGKAKTSNSVPPGGSFRYGIMLLRGGLLRIVAYMFDNTLVLLHL